MAAVSVKRSINLGHPSTLQNSDDPDAALYVPTALEDCTFPSKLLTLLGLQLHQEQLPEEKNSLVM